MEHSPTTIKYCEITQQYLILSTCWQGNRNLWKKRQQGCVLSPLGRCLQRIHSYSNVLVVGKIIFITIYQMVDGKPSVAISTPSPINIHRTIGIYTSEQELMSSPRLVHSTKKHGALTGQLVAQQCKPVFIWQKITHIVVNRQWIITKIICKCMRNTHRSSWTFISRIRHAHSLSTVEHQCGEFLCRIIRRISVFHSVPLIFPVNRHIVKCLNNGICSLYRWLHRIATSACSGCWILEIIHCHGHGCCHTSSNTTIVIIVRWAMLIIRQ